MPWPGGGAPALFWSKFRQAFLRQSFRPTRAPNFGCSSHGEHWCSIPRYPRDEPGEAVPGSCGVMLDRLAICIGLRGGPASEWAYPKVFHYWLKNMGRNGSKIALRRNFCVAFRTLLEFNLRCEFTRTINRVLPLGRSGEWLVWCRKETTRHGPGPARERTAGW